MIPIDRDWCAWAGTTVLCMVALVGCGASKVIRQPVLAEHSWPALDPRIRLERVIELRKDARSGPSRFIRWLGGGKQAPLFERPYGVAWDGEDLLVTDAGARRVVRIAAGGEISMSAAEVLGEPIGVAACSRGIVVSDARNGRVALLDANLKAIRWIIEGLVRPTGVACSEDRIYVVETGKHRVLVLDPDGTWRSLGERGAGKEGFNFPTSVAVDGGWLWVGDTLNFRVQKLDAVSGAFVETFGNLGDAPGEMPRSKGIAVDRAGHLWVSDAYLDQVFLYDPDGAFLMSLGKTGTEQGEFAFPAGIAASADGRIAVVDSLNRRLQIFRILEREEDQP